MNIINDSFITKYSLMNYIIYLQEKNERSRVSGASMDEKEYCAP